MKRPHIQPARPHEILAVPSMLESRPREVPVSEMSNIPSTREAAK